MSILRKVPSILMRHTKATSTDSPDNTTRKRNNTNWHEAASCAIQIELRDYAHLLDFQTEYPLGKNHFRVDLLVIRKLSDQPILKNIGRCFKIYNLFEIKGLGSSVTTDSYYKTSGYAGLLINQCGRKNQYTALDVTLTFLSLHYPANLIKHLRKERKLVVAKFTEGVYHISNEIFHVQIIVTSELSPDDNLYLRCLTNNLRDRDLINKLTLDYEKFQEQDIYIRYMNQLANANAKEKGGSPMVCEGILNLCGTSSEEIINRTKKEQAEYYQPIIDELSDNNKALKVSNVQLKSSNKQLTSSNMELETSNKQLTSFNEKLIAQMNYLEGLLKQHNIPFHKEASAMNEN